VPYLTMMPVIARDKLGLGAGGYGALLACVGVGGLTGALGLAAIGDRIRRGAVLSIASISYAALLVVFSLVRSPALAYPVLFCVGFAMIATNAVANATLQHLVPNELRGRMMASYSFINIGLSSVLGSVIAGSVAHVIGVSWAVGGGGAILLGFSYWVYRKRPELRAV
jgi:MFS family permease